MTAKQRYLFDLNGYLHIKNVLAADELSNAQEAIDRCTRGNRSFVGNAI